MLGEVRQLVVEYRQWLADRTALREVGDRWIEITTPFLDRHNDAIQIYARRENGHYLLTDDGYTIQDLELSGVRLNTGQRQQALQVTLNGFGVRRDGDALVAEATTASFAHKKHNLLQAILAVNDLSYLAAPVVRSLFHEDVAAWLEENNIRYVPQVKLAGRSGYDHVFDFVVPKSRVRPERVLRALARPDRTAAERHIHAWGDTQANRSAETTAYAVLNDQVRATPLEVSTALGAYGVRVVEWTRRHEAVYELQA